jgi:uncharacterized protein (TIGR02266 family)
MADARKDKRTLLSLKIRFKSATLEDFIERYSNDISRGGVFIKAKKPLAVGTLLKFEFILQDQSTLLHGVGRVVWRRDEGDAENPPGMGIKFIKMDPESRAVVQRIAEDRAHPGVFEQGKDGAPVETAGSFDPGPPREADRTKVRHVSEFLASAFEEGGAGEVARREAQAGAERARRTGRSIDEPRVAAARGAFAANRELDAKKRRSMSDAPARGAMSAFGGSGLSSSARMSSSAAPAFDEVDPEDDFLEEETTKVHDHFVSAFPAEADATVVAAEAAMPFAVEKRLTPVVASPASSRSTLESEVPDLFGPAMADSFGPAPGEFIDARLLDPGVATVPPPASNVPEAPGIPAEAFKVSQATEPVWTTRPTPPKKEVSRGWTGLVVLAVLIAGGAVAVWQLGFGDDLADLAESYLGRFEELKKAPQRAATPVAATAERPAESAAAVTPGDDTSDGSETVGAGSEKPSPEAKASPGTPPVEAAEPAIVKFEVTSRPTGAFVSVNGTGAGRTPLDLEYPEGTELTIFSKARGYLARRQQITVQAKQEAVSLVLAPLPYVIEVVSTPVGATASASGVGQVVTPGSLRFKSMPASRTIVISKDGYKTTNQTVALDDFTEETRRLVATVDVTLQKSAATEPKSNAPAAEPVSPQPASPAPVEAKAAAEPTPVPEAPAPSAEADAP